MSRDCRATKRCAIGAINAEKGDRRAKCKASLGTHSVGGVRMDLGPYMLVVTEEFPEKRLGTADPSRCLSQKLERRCVVRCSVKPSGFAAAVAILELTVTRDESINWVPHEGEASSLRWLWPLCHHSSDFVVVALVQSDVPLAQTVRFWLVHRIVEERDEMHPISVKEKRSRPSTDPDRIVRVGTHSQFPCRSIWP